MSDTTHPGETPLRLAGLDPAFIPDRHGVYLQALQAAIDTEPDIRNIALAGPYGVGKSSVLRELSSRYHGRVVTVSLLSLGAEPEQIEAAEGSNPAAQTKTNRIQKEIVKQLLYQQSPSSSPQSRFRRIDRFRWWPEVGLALAVASVLLLVAFGTGLATPLVRAAGFHWPQFPAWIRLAALMVSALTVGAAVVLAGRLLVRGRLGLERISAGPATITLPPRSSSFFDEYLDEIIYFFEVNRAYDIVVLEDLDRFDDPTIFESLHALNGLLNAAHQLRSKKRNIRFVYAVRDSIFEGLGSANRTDSEDSAQVETLRANRTKFFDLIVPIVPFITHRNAGDLLLTLLTDRGFSISQALVDLGARHIPDMRLLYNIVNEYDVFRRTLLATSVPVPGLTPDRLFALILYKNTHAADFEGIRHGGSRLDDLFRLWRTFVNANIDERDRAVRQLQARMQKAAAATDHAAALGGSLRSIVDVLTRAEGTFLATGALVVGNESVDEARLSTPDFWKRLTNGESIALLTQQSLFSGGYVRMRLEREALETLLGETLDPEEWIERSEAHDRAALTRLTSEIEFLRRHAWGDISRRPEFAYDPDGGNGKTFADWIGSILQSDLARDLVLRGYVDSYFSLYVSSFYGVQIRPDAMMYILRNIETGTADPEYPLEPADVEAILNDQGAAVLTESSVRNVSIFDHLLAQNGEAAETVVGALVRVPSRDREFINRYLSSGSEKDRFVTLAAPIMRSIYAYLAADAPLDHGERIRLLNAAIERRSDLDYEFTDELRAVLGRDYPGFDIYTGGGSSNSQARASVRYLVDVDVVLPDVSPLSSEVRTALSDTRAFALTAQNLEQLAGTDIGLDQLRESNDRLYRYALDRPDDYLVAFAESEGTASTISDSRTFVQILQDASAWNANQHRELIRAAAEGCVAQTLEDVPEQSWRPLLETQRTTASYENVAAYLAAFVSVDESLAALLRETTEIIVDDSVAEEDRRAVALAVINCTALSPERRVRLASSLSPGLIPAAAIEPESGKLVGELLRTGLIADDASAFEPRLMTDWSTQEYAITQSEQFADLLSPATLQVKYIEPLADSARVSHAVKANLLESLPLFHPTGKACAAVARSIVRREIVPDVDDLLRLAENNTPAPLVVQMLDTVKDAIDIADLSRVLARLDDPWASVAVPGTKRPTVPDTPANRAVLDRLEIAGIVSRYKPEGEAALRVFLSRS